MVQPGWRSARSLLFTIALLVGALSIPSGAARAQVCTGDCDGGGTVAINELILGVNIALGSAQISACEAFDCQSTGMVPINCLIQGVNNALAGCGGGAGTPTPTGEIAATPTPTGETGATPTPTGETGATPTPTGGPSLPLTKVRLTYLQLKYDVTKPAFLNNSVPVKFGITSNSADPNNPGKGSVVVLFSFVEAAPAPPATPRSCDSNGIALQLVGSGVEQQFEADIFPTSDCASWVGAGGVANIGVDFDAGLRMAGMPTGIDYPPVVFSVANAGAADNQLCRKTLDPNAADPGRGCVYALQLQPTQTGTDGKPLVKVMLESLKPESSVAVLWPTAEDPDVPMGSTESAPPSLLVNAAFVLDGRDPYKNKIDPNGDGVLNAEDFAPEDRQQFADLMAADPTISDDLKFGLDDAELNALDDLPMAAMVKYDLVPTSLVAQNEWLPLAIDNPKDPNPDGHVQEIELTELDPGTENGVAHALYIDGDARTAVSPGGAWAAETDFTVRGCIVASFEEGGNTGEEEDPEDVPAGGDVPMGDCRTFKVVLMRAPVPMPTGFARTTTVPVNTRSFDQTFVRAVGDDKKAQISGSLSTNNTLDLNGARTNSEGVLELKGYFNVKLFRVFGKANALTALATSNYDVGVEAFGISLFGQQMMGAELSYEVPLGPLMKSFNFPVINLGFGPFGIGISAGVGGEIGLAPKFTVSAKQGGEPSVPALMNASSNGLLAVTFGPRTALTGNAEAAVNIVVAKAAVVATLKFVEIGFPVTTSLRWGVTELDGMAVKKLTVLGDVKWDLELNWFNVNVDVVGRLLIFTKTFNVFKYENTPEKINLLTRQLGEPVVLESGTSSSTPTTGPEGSPTATVGGDVTPTPTGGAEMSPTPTGEAPATETPTGEIPPTQPEAIGALLATPTPTATPAPNGE